MGRQAVSFSVSALATRRLRLNRPGHGPPPRRQHHHRGSALFAAKPHSGIVWFAQPETLFLATQTPFTDEQPHARPLTPAATCRQHSPINPPTVRRGWDPEPHPSFVHAAGTATRSITRAEPQRPPARRPNCGGDSLQPHPRRSLGPEPTSVRRSEAARPHPRTGKWKSRA